MLHAIVADAASSMHALRQFIATRLDLADQTEAEGAPDAADAMREVWTGVLDSMDTLDRALAAELADVPVEEPAVA